MKLRLAKYSPYYVSSVLTSYKQKGVRCNRPEYTPGRIIPGVKAA